MNHQVDRTSSQSDSHSDDLQSAVLEQQNKHLLNDFKPFEITRFRSADKIHLLLNTALHLEQHYFGTDQQTLLSLPEKAPQVSRISFFHISYRFREVKSQNAQIFLLVILSGKNIPQLFMRLWTFNRHNI